MRATMWTVCGPLALHGILWAGIRPAPPGPGSGWWKEFHQTYPLATNGEVRVENINGRVRITTWERAEVQVDAVKSADTQADLNATKIKIDSHPGRDPPPHQTAGLRVGLEVVAQAARFPQRGL